VATAQAQLASAKAQQAQANAKLASARAKLAADGPTTPPAQLAADEAAVAQANAQVAAAKASVSNAEQQVRTAEDPATTTAADAAAIAQAEQGVTQAENGVTSAQAGVQTARTAAAATTLVAPVAGIVTAVDVTAGQPAPTGTAIQMRSDGLDVVANVAEQDVTKLSPGLKAAVTFPALSVTGTATMAAMPTAANSSSGAAASSAVTFPVTLVVPTPPSGLLPGMSAQVSITIAARANVLAVPTTAIQGSETAPTVQVMVDGKPVTRAVQIGLSTASTTEVVVGLSQGEVVVTGVVNPVSSVTTGGLGGGGLTSGTRTGGFGGGTGGFGGGGTRGGG
jgi:membrane fusion protein, macrolide-specific efflux system